MSEQTNTLTRRKFLKGAAYTSALSVGGLSGLSFAGSANNPGPADMNGKSNMTSESGLLAVTLANHSDKPVALDATKPVSVEKVNGWVVVKINKAKPGADPVVTGQQTYLAAGQQCAFAVDAEVAPMLTEAGAYIVMTNEYSHLDNMVPLAHYDAMVA